MSEENDKIERRSFSPQGGPIGPDGKLQQPDDQPKPVVNDDKPKPSTREDS